VLGDGIAEIKPTISNLNVEVICNPQWREGMASSLQEGFRFVRDRYPDVQAIIVILGDQVKLLSQDISDLIKKHEEEPVLIIATNYNGKPGVPVLFPKSAWSLIDLLQGDEGARRILEKRNDVVLVDNPAAFYDVDSPEDLNP
jgi:molybdenum cofactor cytidylyltransferase